MSCAAWSTWGSWRSRRTRRGAGCATAIGRGRLCTSCVAPTNRQRLPVLNRQRLPVQPAKIAGESSSETGRITYDEPAESRTSLIRDPLVDPLVRTHACAREDTLAQFDELAAVYPRKDRQMAARRAWVALHPTLDLGAFIVAHVRMRVRAEWQQVPVRFVPLLVRFLGERRWEERATAAVEPDAPAVDWFEECKRLHNLACGERLHHHHRMLRDADQAVPAVATPVDEGTADPSRKSAS